MRMVFTLVLASVVVAAPAFGSASFANRRLEFGVTGYKIFPETSAEYGLGLVNGEFGYYLDSGFEVFARGTLSLYYLRTGVGPNGGAGFVWGGGGQIGTRYLFLEETIRPYIEVHLSVVGIGNDAGAPKPSQASSQIFVGGGAGLGLDLFFTDSVSFGPRVYSDFFFTLNAWPIYAFGGGLNISTYF